MAKPYKLFLSILARAVRVTNSEGTLNETVLSQQLALVFTSIGLTTYNTFLKRFGLVDSNLKFSMMARDYVHVGLKMMGKEKE